MSRVGGVRELSVPGASIGNHAAVPAEVAAMGQPEVYLLTLHEPYTDPRHPVPINALVVHALTLLHRDVPQPDGEMMYRCLTEFPGRHAGEIVPVSTLTYELDGGRRWPEVADWMAVTAALVRLARAGYCDSMPLGLPKATAAVLINSPTGETVLHHRDGAVRRCGPEHRRMELDNLARHLADFLAAGPLWPGDSLRPLPSGVDLAACISGREHLRPRCRDHAAVT